MMKNKFWGTDILIAVLLLICIELAVMVFLGASALAPYARAAVLFSVVRVMLCASRVRKVIHSVFYGSGKQGARQQLSFENLSIPLAIVNGDSTVWYNNAFRDEILGEQDMYLASFKKIFPDFSIKEAAGEKGVAITYEEKKYTVYSSSASENDDLWICYFVDDTQLKYEASEYHLSRPVVMQMVLDTYEEALKDVKESVRAQILADLDRLIEDSAAEAGGISIKLGVARYYLIIEERNFNIFYDSRFEILARARTVHPDVTLSIGVGRGGADMIENDTLARQALNMALGRGGDQAVMKTQNGYEFFGGTKQGLEKNSKVRSRIVANALHDIIMQSDIVFCMGHKNSDLDSVGASIGMARAVEALGKKAYVVVREETSLAQNLIANIREDDPQKEFIISPERALALVSDNSFLVICDTHSQRMTESEELCARINKKTVIDHHRRMVDYINDTVVSYHETYVSSACELVTELLGYILPTGYKLNSVYADAVMSGIMLDTKNFSEKTGVRTFEAAVYLRRMGASTTEVYRLFDVSKEVYRKRSELVNMAENYDGIALVVSDSMPKDLSVAVPQAANELLHISNVQASIVAVMVDDQVNVSARSLGDVNVQLIMESLGGGGHLTMAGAQIKDCTLDEARQKIMQAIDNYKK